MIDAKNKFREGYILIKQPFQFVEMENPVQAYTIAWAYSEQPVFEKEMTVSAKESLEDLLNETPFMNPKVHFKENFDDYLSREIEKIYSNEANFNQLHSGDIVQTNIDGITCRFYPDEYSIIDKDTLSEIMEEEGYHAICSQGLYKTKEFLDKFHYLRSRGISEHIAKKWAALGFKELVYYKPYFQLLSMYSRVIYPDSFYEIMEGVSLEDQTKNNPEVIIQKKRWQKLK